jgi:hypothetical protein
VPRKNAEPTLRQKDKDLQRRKCEFMQAPNTPCALMATREIVYKEVYLGLKHGKMLVVRKYLCDAHAAACIYSLMFAIKGQIVIEYISDNPTKEQS